MDFIGIVEVPISRLLFVEGGGQRLYNEAHQERLADLFRDTKADHNNARHLIEGYIDVSESETVLREAGLSLLQIKQQNSDGKNPFIEHATVRYTHGQHRIAAAKELRRDIRWTVRLFCTNIEHLFSNLVVRRQTEQYQHEKPYSDGHIYAKLRRYQDVAFDYSEWHHRLTKPKKVAMLAIDLRVDVALALNALINIPAILDELFLTSIQKNFVLRLDDELLAGINNLYSEWFRIAGGNTTILEQMDKKTLATLAGRAPTASHDDHRLINAAFRSRQVFPGVDNMDEREALQFRVQQTNGLIPSLLSMQSNLRFLGIAAAIIWEFLIPKSLRLRAKQEKLSLKTTLRGCWKETAPYVEIREGEFALAAGSPSFDLVYVQVFLAALRQFPYLSRWEPKVERGEKLPFALDAYQVAQFCRRAKFLGIQTAIIDENLKAFIPDVQRKEMVQFRNLLDESDALARPESRWGRPSTSIYRIIQLEGFLPKILDSPEMSQLGAISLLRNTLMRFFRLPSFSIDLTQDVCSINRPRQLQYHQLDTIIEESESEMDIDSRSDERSGSDVSMQDIDVCEHAVEVATHAPATTLAIAQGHTLAPTFDAVSPLGAHHGGHGASTAQFDSRERAVYSPDQRSYLSGHASGASQVRGVLDWNTNHTLEPPARSRSIVRSTSAVRSPLKQPHLPPQSQLQMAGRDDAQGGLSHILMGESAMTPPRRGSDYHSEDLNWSLASLPPSPNRQGSSMTDAGQRSISRDALQEGSSWHQASDIRFSGDTLRTSVDLRESIFPFSTSTPRRLSEFPANLIPAAASISDRQSGSSQQQSSYYHSNSPSQAKYLPSPISGSTAPRSAYTAQLTSSHENGGNTRGRHLARSSMWQGFEDSDDDFASISI